MVEIDDVADTSDLSFDQEANVDFIKSPKFEQREFGFDGKIPSIMWLLGNECGWAMHYEQ